MNAVEGSSGTTVLPTSTRRRPMWESRHDYCQQVLRLAIVVVICALPVSPEDAFGDDKTRNKQILVDDFEKLGGTNLLGGESGAFSDSEGRGGCYVFPHSRSDQVLHGEGYSLFVQWDTSEKGAFGGYWTKLDHLDLDDLHYLTLWVRGMAGGEKFKIGLRGRIDETYETKVSIEDLVEGGITEDWQKIRVPLKRFGAVQDWRDVTILSINFEHAIGSGRGAILVDDIAFEN